MAVRVATNHSHTLLEMENKLLKDKCDYLESIITSITMKHKEFVIDHENYKTKQDAMKQELIQEYQSQIDYISNLLSQLQLQHQGLYTEHHKLLKDMVDLETQNTEYHQKCILQKQQIETLRQQRNDSHNDLKIELNLSKSFNNEQNIIINNLEQSLQIALDNKHLVKSPTSKTRRRHYSWCGHSCNKTMTIMSCSPNASRHASIYSTTNDTLTPISRMLTPPLIRRSDTQSLSIEFCMAVTDPNISSKTINNKDDLSRSEMSDLISPMSHISGMNHRTNTYNQTGGKHVHFKQPLYYDILPNRHSISGCDNYYKM